LRRGVSRPQSFTRACHASRNVNPEEARRFFESHFSPWEVKPVGRPGFLTAYFEPEFPGALARSDAFPTPLYGRPTDLVTRGPSDVWHGLDPALAAAQVTPDGLRPYADREAIDNGALAGRGLEILWLRDPVDRFVLQVQGSGRIRLPDGTLRRLTYSGRNGHPYTSLGRILVEEEGIAPAAMTMDKLVARLKSSPEEARRLIHRNRSFVFFALAENQSPELGPIGGEGVPLTPLRSVAADRSVWPYGTPVVLSGQLPLMTGGTEPLARAGIIQDTGSAILGPARIDLFMGSGPEAGHLAGLVQHELTLFVLWPHDGPEQQ
jgi:membrane-bound lytic murein transglycosylase A